MQPDRVESTSTVHLYLLDSGDVLQFDREVIGVGAE
jgi:hypothetical protein